MPPTPALPRFGRQSTPADFFRGLALPFQAIGLVMRSRRLLLLSAAASLVTFLALGVLVVLLGLYTDDLVRRFIGAPDSWYGRIGFAVLVALSFLLLLVVGANTVPLLLLAPLQDPISEATESECGEFRAPPFRVSALIRGTAVSLWHTLARVAILLGGHALLFLLSLLPAIGAVLWSVMAALWTMAWLSAEYLDAPMARHLYRFRQVRQVVLSRLWLCMGFGAAVYVLLWLPVLNLFFIPLAVVAGTLLFRGLRASGSLPPPGASGKAVES
jgi:CysZ protein